MCTGKAVEIAHFVATVSTRESPQTISQKSTVWSLLATWSRWWRCALINSRAARNVFAATVNDTQNRKFWMRKTYCLTKFQRDVTLQRKAISQKLLRVALHTLFLHSFTVVNQSPRFYFWLQKGSITCTATAEFKVQSNSTCAYIPSIRNYSFFIYCYTRAAHTEQYPATLNYFISTRVSIFFLRGLA